MDKHRILIVDDSPSELRILMELLKNKYAVVVSTSGEQAIAMVKSDPAIELVLLDVMMPNMNGYETCRQILEYAPKLPVLFVSSNTSTDEILTGFDAGGIDYLAKPIDTDVVSRKVKMILSERNKMVELETENKSSSDMVMSVITSAGHLGTVLGFLRAGLKIKSHEGLLSALFDVFDILNIDACVQLRTPKKAYTQSTNGIITPLEQDLLSRTSVMKGRFLERGTRYIVNFETVSVIIKNMPIDDMMVLGDLRDNLMMILEDTNALNEKLANATDHKAVGTLSKETMIDLVATLNMAAKIQEAQKDKMLSLVEDMLPAFESIFSKLGLHEHQEEALASIVNQQTTAFSEYIEQSIEMDDALVSIQQQIKNLVD